MTTLEIIIHSAEIAAVIFVSYALLAERKSLKRVNDNYKSVFESTDINRLRTYYEESERLIKKQFDLYKETIIPEVQKALDEAMIDYYKKIGRQFDELASFANEFFSVLPEDKREEFIKNNLPSCMPLFTAHTENEEGASLHNDLQK